METNDHGTPEADSAEERWPLVKVFDLVALVLLAAVVVQIVGGAIAGAGFPSSDFPGNTSVPLYSRLFSATIWANLTTGLLLFAGLAVSTLPHMVWDVPPKDKWPGVASKIVMGIGGVASLAAVAGMVGIGNTLWNSPNRSPLDSWDVATSLAAVVVSGLAAILSWFSIPYVQKESEPT